MKKLMFIILLFCFSGLYLGAQSVGDPAPDFSFTDYEGNTFTLSDHLGKVVFIFTFGNTCPSCLAVGNDTETRVNKVYGKRDDFVAVGVDFWNSSSSNTSVNNFAQQTGIEYPLLVKGGDMASLYSTTYDRLLVVDQSGILRHKGNTLVRNDLNQAISVIEEYLAPLSSGLNHSGSFAVEIFPVPAGNQLTLRIGLLKADEVKIKIYNSIGQLQAVRYKADFPAGRNEIYLNVSDLSEDIYFYHLETSSGESRSGKFLIKR